MDLALKEIKGNPKAWRYFNSGSQATSWQILSDCALVQRSTVWQCEQHEDDLKKH